MAHSAPDFETKDVYGKTIQLVGTVTTIVSLFPSPQVGRIQQVLIRNPDNNGVNDVLLYNLDGTSNFFRLKRGEYIGWVLKNNPSNTPITQIQLKSLSGTVSYEILINVEP
jgi:hypothetical protein